MNSARVPSDEITTRQIRGWCIAALFPLGLASLMHFVQDAGQEEFARKHYPGPMVATVADFLLAECKTHRGRGGPGAYRSPHYMRTTYAFSASPGPNYDGAGALVSPFARPAELFTVIKHIRYDSWAECEADLPVVQAAMSPQPVWYQSNNPNAATTQLEEPDSIHFLWFGLAGLPVAVYAWLLWVLRRRQGHVMPGQTTVAGTPKALGDSLYWPLRFVKFTQRPFVKTICFYLIFVLLIGGFVGQIFWGHYAEKAGKERVRAAAAQS